MVLGIDYNPLDAAELKASVDNLKTVDFKRVKLMDCLSYFFLAKVAFLEIMLDSFKL